MTSDLKATDAIFDELLRARGRMTLRERAMGDALVDLAEDMFVAAEMMSAFAEHEPTLAVFLGPLIERLQESGRQAIGTHATVIGELLGVTVQ